MHREQRAENNSFKEYLSLYKNLVMYYINILDWFNLVTVNGQKLFSFTQNWYSVGCFLPTQFMKILNVKMQFALYVIT